jgi:hypothetical protein
VQLIEQLSAAFVSQGFKYCIQLAQLYATIWLHVNKRFCLIATVTRPGR